MERVLIPGSSWLYFKLYTGHKSADELLKDVIHPMCCSLIENGVIDKFFFIRYSDPKFHIRLRLHTDKPLNYGLIFRDFYDVINPYMQSGLVWNVQCDTYKREIERYGEETMIAAETIFCIDSEAIILLLQIISLSDKQESLRWFTSIKLIDDIYNALNFNLEKKLDHITMLANGFKNEFGFTSSMFTKQLNNKFRLYRKDISDIFSSYPAELERITNMRLTHLKDAIGKLDRFPDSFIESLIHMSMNRLFRSKNRLYEMVIYEMLSKHYESELSRMKYSKSL